MEKGINSVATSSCGRLFHAVASILVFRHEIRLEGSAGVDLEMAAVAGTEGVDSFRMEFTGSGQVGARR